MMLTIAATEREHGTSLATANTSAVSVVAASKNSIGISELNMKSG
jgi:hypothetical protein